MLLLLAIYSSIPQFFNCSRPCIILIYQSVIIRQAVSLIVRSVVGMLSYVCMTLLIIGDRCIDRLFYCKNGGQNNGNLTPAFFSSSPIKKKFSAWLKNLLVKAFVRIILSYIFCHSVNLKPVLMAPLVIILPTCVLESALRFHFVIVRFILLNSPC